MQTSVALLRVSFKTSNEITVTASEGSSTIFTYLLCKKSIMLPEGNFPLSKGILAHLT